MAEVDIQPNFGAELKVGGRMSPRLLLVMLTDVLQDGFKPVNAWVVNGIAWLDDIQQYYRERSVIEKEYSAKLAALAKKYYERKSKKSSPLSVGDTPAMTPGSLERCAKPIVIPGCVTVANLVQCISHHLDDSAHNSRIDRCRT
jgi:hypothetical protein